MNTDNKLMYYTRIGYLDMDYTTNVDSFDNCRHLLNANEDAYDWSQLHWLAF